MAQQNINLGTPPAGSDGDTVRSAMGKIQGNFTDLYSQASSNAAAAEAAQVSANAIGTMKNLLINGDFDYWQRATTLTTGLANSYVADRWKTFANNSTVVVSQQAFATGQVMVPFEPTFFMRHDVTSVAGAANGVCVSQYIEDVRALAGDTVTISFWAMCNINRNISVELGQHFAGGSADASGIGVTTFSLTQAWQKFTFTVDIPTIAGKTIGTTGANATSITFWFDAGSNFNSRSGNLGQESGVIDIAQVQIEKGSLATPFDRRLAAIEFELCQRYCQTGIAAYMGMSGVLSQFVAVPFNSPMRIAPAISVSNYIDNDGAGTGNVSSVYATANGIYQVTNSSSSTKLGRYSFNFLADSDI